MTAQIEGMAHVGDVEIEDWVFDAENFSESSFARLWIEGDGYIKTMWRKNAKPDRLDSARLRHLHKGQLWERLAEQS